MKTALVTGASGVIGAGIARGLAQTGYALALHYHTNQEAAESLLHELGDMIVPALCVQADITNAKEIAGMFRLIGERLGTVEILVNNAGAALPQRLFTDCTESDYDRMFDVNVRGMTLCTRAAIPDMLRRGRGAIVNISSVFGVTGGSCEVLYSAAKAAVIGFTKALAKELAPSGITVNCVAPGFVPSAMNGHLSEDIIQNIRLETPLLRLGNAEDVAQAVCYLAYAPFVTGQILCVDGGISI